MLNIHRSCDGRQTGKEEVSVHRLKPLVTARPINKETFIKIWIRIPRVGNTRRRKKKKREYLRYRETTLWDSRNACNTRVPRLNSKRIKPIPPPASLFSGNGLNLLFPSFHTVHEELAIKRTRLYGMKRRGNAIGWCVGSKNRWDSDKITPERRKILPSD